MRAQNGWARLRQHVWAKSGPLAAWPARENWTDLSWGGDEKDDGGFESYGPAEIASAEILTGLIVRRRSAAAIDAVAQFTDARAGGQGDDAGPLKEL